MNPRGGEGAEASGAEASDAFFRPSSSALTALVSAAGGRSVALRHAAVALVGADWKAAECRQAGLRALHRSGCALRFRWLCEAVEAGDADAVARELYATNH